MPAIVRDVLHKVTQRPGAAESASRDTEALAHLDDRLSGLSLGGTSGGTRCAVSIRPGDCAVDPERSTDRQGPTAQNCKALIASIGEEGGNLVPVVIRPLPKGSARPYELLVGNRRRFAVEWLNRNGRPEIRLNALVVDLSDEEAFRLADIENQEREDIPELDRARAYQRALTLYYDGVQSRMADALRLSGSQLSRMLALAELPEEIVGAFASTDELRVRHSEVLTPLLRRDDRRALVIEEAIRIGAEQERLCSAGDKLLPSGTVLSRLRDAGADTPSAPAEHSASDAYAQELGSIEAFPGFISVELVVPEFANLDEVLERLKQAIIECRRNAPKVSG